MDFPQAISDGISSAAMGFWAFCGLIMRGNVDWQNPKTGRFSIPLFATSIATAMVMGEIAAAAGHKFSLEPFAIRALAAVFAYIGPAATIQILKRRFLGEKDDGNTPGK